MERKRLERERGSNEAVEKCLTHCSLSLGFGFLILTLE